MKKFILAGFLCPVVCGPVFAQPPVDITLAENGAGQLEVRLRPNGPFNELVSSLTFTLRWQEQEGPAFTSVDPVFPQSEFIPLASSAIVSGGNGYLYRTYNAVALVAMYEYDQNWEGGVEYPVCTLEVLQPGVEIELVDDDFTAANNRNFYVSLNGNPSTGSIFESSGTTVNAMAVNSGNGYIDVMLTPANDFFGWVNELDFTLRWPDPAGSLGNILQEPGLASVIPMTKEGPEVSEGGYTYQRFRGQGNQSLAVAQSGWTGGEDHVLMRLPVIGTIEDATVADDAWTASNDGAYSILLNGVPSAGVTDESLSTLVLEFADVIPQMQVIGDELQVVTSPSGSGKLILVVLNSAGQPVAQRRSKWGITERFNMASWSSGIYALQAITQSGIVARRFVR